MARTSQLEQPKPRVQRNTPEILASRGWTVQAAAKYLGCDYGHLGRVISGKRVSNSLSESIAALPDLTKQNA